MDDSFGDGMRFSGSCSGIDKEGSVDREDSFALCRVEFGHGA